jgi:uncharacterized protein YkwD
VSAAGNSIGTPVFNDPTNIGVPDLSLYENTTPLPQTEYLGMRVDTLTAPHSAVVGGEISGEVHIRNTGTTPAYYVQLDFYLSADREINEDDIWVQRKTATIHPPGFETVLPYQFSVPSGLTERAYYVGLVVCSYVSDIFVVHDSTLAPHITNISRSTRPRPSSLKPDLAVTSISYPIGNYSPGTPLEILYTVENTGGVSTAFSVTFYLSRDAEITPSDQLLWSDHYAKGYERMNQTTTSLYMIPEYVIPGTYYLGAIVDNLHQTGDVNRENNSLSSPIPITIDPTVPFDQDAFNQMVEAYIAEKTNIYRSYVGSPPLTHTVELSELAKMHATDMANRNYFSHYTPEGLSPIDRAQTFGFSREKMGKWGVFHDVAENIVKIHEGNSIGSGYSGFVDGTDPESVATVMLLEWISSPSHHATLTDERLDSFGIGVVKQGSTYYGVVDFF